MSPDDKPPFQNLSDILGSTGLFSLAQGVKGPALPQPLLFQDRWFKDQHVYVDGYIFDRCRFDNCVLVVQAGTCAFRHCYIAPNCRLFFSGNVLVAVKLLLHVLRVQGRIVMLNGEEGVFATLNPDGTFSIEE